MSRSSCFRRYGRLPIAVGAQQAVRGEVGRAIGLNKRFTQRGLRRTFNDLARAAQVEGVVTKSIPGHLTARMRERYSTVASVEQRASIARVIDFAQAKPATNSEDTVPSIGEPS